jgi:hypothetical protein
MAGTATPIFPQTIRNGAAEILPASGSTVVTLATGGTNGTKIESLNLINTDTNAYSIQMVVQISSVSYILGVLALAASTGYSSTVPALAPLRNGNIPGFAFDSNGNPYLYLASGATLGFSSTTTVSTGKAIHIFGQGGDF